MSRAPAARARFAAAVAGSTGRTEPGRRRLSPSFRASASTSSSRSRWSRRRKDKDAQMPIRIYKPTSPGRRSMSVSTFEEITKKEPEKSLIEPLKKHAGRNNRGKITIRHRGGGHKRFYRIIDFKRNKLGVPGTVATIEYDPNRSARIALIHYADGEKRYILAPLGLKVGDRIMSGAGAEIRVGNALPLRNIPLGTQIHNIELQLGRGGQMVRSAGNAAQLMARDEEYAQVRLPSGEVRRVRVECMATIGQIGNVDHENIRVGKAGRNRHL